MPRAKNRPAKDERATSRPTRIPVTGKRDILTVRGKEDGYFYCWVNDVGTQIQRYIDGGYEVVENDGSIVVGTSSPTETGSAVTVTVDKTSGEKAVLMRIREDWHQEDLAAEQAELAEMESSMFREQEERKGHYGKVEMS